jgi:hypothetical protein
MTNSRVSSGDRRLGTVSLDCSRLGKSWPPGSEEDWKGWVRVLASRRGTATTGRGTYRRRFEK